MFPLNSNVRLKGLKKAEFNGKFGVVRSSPDENTGRLDVFVPDLGKSVALKPENLESAAAVTREVRAMGIKELKAELASYGLATSSYCEKSQLQEAVLQARSDGYKIQRARRNLPRHLARSLRAPRRCLAQSLPRRRKGMGT